jgi:cytochrome c peroxidase
MLPPVSRDEMRGQPGENELADLGEDFEAVWAALLERLLAIPLYVQLLHDAYPAVALQDLDFAHAANAIAAFEVRAFARTDSRFERFVRGDDAALSPEEVAGGLEFYGRAGCARCHSGRLFSDQEHHNVGLPQLGPGLGDGASGREDYGRGHVTGLTEDRYAFRTPTLLNVGLTGPYGHAGQFADLRDFVNHYRDVELSHLQYDVSSNVFDPELVTTLVPNSAEVLARLDPLLAAPNDFDGESVYVFVLSLSADNAFDLDDVVPDSVPSGLPLD